MAPPSVAPSDPFEDHSQTSKDHEYPDASTLSVGRNASLTLATDSLIVLGKRALMDWKQCRLSDFAIDEDFTRRATSNCCGLWPKGMVPFPMQIANKPEKC